MRDASLQRFLRCRASPARERAAEWPDDASGCLNRRMFGRCEIANRSFRWGSVSAVVLMFRGMPPLLGEILAGLASPARPGVVAARIDRFVRRRLPQGRVDCPVRAALAVTVEV